MLIHTLPPLTSVERRAFDYSALDEAMAHLDAVVRHTRHFFKNTLADPDTDGRLDFNAIID